MDIFTRFWQQAEANPSQIAVVEADRHYSYLDFKVLVQRIAHALALHGKEPKVLIQLPQAAKAYASMLATLMVGGVYSPVNITAPEQRQQNIAQEFLPDVIITSEDMPPLKWSGAKKTDVITVEKLGKEKLTTPRKQGNLAYIIFTSGSTGRPKGVMIPRRALSHYINWAIPALQLHPGKRCSQHPNIGFDLSVVDIYATLCSGATLCPLISPLHRMMPAMAVRDLKIDTWISVPSVIDLMEKGKQLTPDFVGNLERIFFCGEPLFRRQLESLFAANPNVKILNAYGPTEATVSCTELPLTTQNYKKHCKGSVALGAAIDGMELRLDGDTSDQGELLLLGEQLAQGYWNDKDKTDKAFITLDNGQRAYRTGDWVRKEGNDLYFSHRIDRQVKIDGYRIELGEVDEALRQGGTTAACTLIHNNALHSFVEAAEGCTKEHLLEQVQKTLPHYAVPKEIILLTSLPRNSNDKIDALALEKRLKDE